MNDMCIASFELKFNQKMWQQM